MVTVQLNIFFFSLSKLNRYRYFLKDLKMSFFLEDADANGNSGLHLASEHGHLSIVSILIECNIDSNLKNGEGTTPLELSCRKGFFEISKLLIQSYSAPFSQYNARQNEKNENPLHVACFEGAHEVVRLLLLKGRLFLSLSHNPKRFYIYIFFANTRK